LKDSVNGERKILLLGVNHSLSYQAWKSRHQNFSFDAYSISSFASESVNVPYAQLLFRMLKTIEQGSDTLKDNQFFPLCAEKLNGIDLKNDYCQDILRFVEGKVLSELPAIFKREQLEGIDFSHMPSPAAWPLHILCTTSRFFLSLHSMEEGILSQNKEKKQVSLDFEIEQNFLKNQEQLLKDLCEGIHYLKTPEKDRVFQRLKSCSEGNILDISSLPDTALLLLERLTYINPSDARSLSENAKQFMRGRPPLSALPFLSGYFPDLALAESKDLKIDKRTSHWLSDPIEKILKLGEGAIILCGVRHLLRAEKKGVLDYFLNHFLNKESMNSKEMPLVSVVSIQRWTGDRFEDFIKPID
jgi:hypothetical protein